MKYFKENYPYVVVAIVFFILGYFMPRTVDKSSELSEITQEKVNREITQTKFTDDETAKWQGKKIDWLERGFDINKTEEEFDDEGLKQVFSSGWTIPTNPYTMEEKELEKVEMNEGHSWKSYSKALAILNKADLSITQRQYFFDNNYVPRSVDHFDVTGDGKPETLVTSLTLGCGRCVDFYFTIFTNDGTYNTTQTEGVIIKSEDENGFYLVDIDYPTKHTSLNISKFRWNSTKFVEVARKETVWMSGYGSAVAYHGVVSKISTSGEARFYRYDTETKKVIDSGSQYGWFWAMPIKVPDDVILTDTWVGFVRENKDSVFKITGTKGVDDCEYWDQEHCVENVDIQRIEVVGTNKIMIL